MSSATDAALPARQAPAGWFTAERIAAAGGIIWAIVLSVGDLVRGLPPDNSSTTQELAEFYIDNSWGTLFAHITFNVSNLFLIFFFAYLWKVLRAAEGEPGWLSLLVFGGGIMGAAVSTIGNAFWGTAGTMARYYELSPQEALLLFNLTVIFFIAWLSFVVMQIGVAVLVFRTGVFPRWIGWLGLVAAALWLVHQWPIPPDSSTAENILLDYPGPLSHFATLIWVVAISVILIRRAGREAQPAASTGTP